MGFVCCVPGCFNKAVYRFPEDKKLRRQWVLNINRLEVGSKYKLFTPDNTKHRVCSDHFKGGKKTATNNVPTIFTGRGSTPTQRNTQTSTQSKIETVTKSDSPIPDVDMNTVHSAEEPCENSCTTSPMQTCGLPAAAGPSLLPATTDVHDHNELLVVDALNTPINETGEPTNSDSNNKDINQNTRMSLLASVTVPPQRSEVDPFTFRTPPKPNSILMDIPASTSTSSTKKAVKPTVPTDKGTVTPNKAVRIVLPPGSCAPLQSNEVELPFTTPKAKSNCKQLLPLTPTKYSISRTHDHTYCHPASLPVTPKKRKLMGDLKKATTNVFTLRQSVSRARAEVKLLKARVLDIDVVIGDKTALNLYTGFKQVKHFEALLAFLKPDEGHVVYPTGGDGYRNPLSYNNSILLCLTKYKLDVPQKDLAFRFGIAQSDVSRIFCAITDLMYRRFREVTIWPSQKLVRDNLPDCFKEKYANTRIIIDCTEIFIQRPSSATAQQLTYSTYKSHNTAKALIGITPNCFISFLPDLQPGRLSDKEIVIRSGLVDLLEPGDIVMADRGFTIEDLLNDSVDLNIPPFLHDKTQFAPDEVAVTRSIASVRIHVERVIGRVRRYAL